MNAVIAFDADNTIWDTDSVFRNAQLSMLHVFAAGGFVASETSELTTLREIDKQIGKALGHFEYDFRLLATALYDHYVQRNTVADSIRRTLSRDPQEAHKNQLIDSAYRGFLHSLSKIPTLYGDTIPVLSYVKQLNSKGLPTVTLLVSEGDSDRIERILRRYRIRQRHLFDVIFIGTKSKATFRRVKEIGAECLSKHEPLSNERNNSFIMVGDNLERDIYFANQVGFTTIYKQSSYLGHEKRQGGSKFKRPDYVINELKELPEILGTVIRDC